MEIEAMQGIIPLRVNPWIICNISLVWKFPCVEGAHKNNLWSEFQWSLWELYKLLKIQILISHIFRMNT